MHDIITYLANHTLQQLEDEHGVCARLSNDRSKISLNYDQIKVKSGDRLAEQCRGLIVRPHLALPSGDAWKTTVVGTADVVAHPMDRFYNHNDPAAAPIDWSCPGLRVQEKLDGTMIVLYYDHRKGEWHAATRSVPEADLPIHTGHLEVGDMTFSGLFWWGMHCTLLDSHVPVAHPDQHRDAAVALLPQGALDPTVTYVFELTSHINQIVVNYTRPGVTLLAARRITDGREIDLSAVELPVPRPRTWQLDNVQSIVSFVDNASPRDLEGAVVIDGKFRRIKVKSKGWLLASRAKDSVESSARNALECVIAGKVDDIVPLLPTAIGDRLLVLQAGYAAYCERIDAQFKQASSMHSTRKQFAEWVLGLGGWSAPFFALMDRRALSAREWIHGNYVAGKLSTSAIDGILLAIDR